MTTFRIGTRGSQLALWQANTVKAMLEERGHRVELVIIKTSGDRLSEIAGSGRASAEVAMPIHSAGSGRASAEVAMPMHSAGSDRASAEVAMPMHALTPGKRLFVKEIEDAMLKREVDLAVHSSKDMPADLPPGLGIAAVLPREDPRDAIVLPRVGSRVKGPGSEVHTRRVRPRTPGQTSKDPGPWTLVPGPDDEYRRIATALGPSAVFGTSSIRRIAQLRAAFASATFQPVRGNVDTRLRKLDEGGYDALILAAAGLRRLGLGERISTLLPIDICTPAPGQGTIAIEIRQDDERTRAAVAALNDLATAIALEAERALIAALGGGCQLPLGGIAVPVERDRLELSAVVMSADASRVIRERATGSPKDPAALGRRVADALTKRGAAEILDEIRAAQEK